MRLRVTSLTAIAIGLAFAWPALASAPPGWTIAGVAPADYEFAVDATTAASGSKSASITAKTSAKKDGFATLMQSIAAEDYRGSRLRLSAYLRTDSATRALMWMRVDGPTGKVVSFDNMDSRPLTGTTAWSRYSIVLDVPSDSADIAFGFLLYGTGKMWGDGFKLEKVDSTVAVTSAGPALSRAPVNLDFEDSEVSVSATWEPRTLKKFATMTMGCDNLVEYVRFALLSLGAHDLHIDQRGCRGPSGAVISVDATFLVLAPATKTDGQARGQMVEARWQTVEIHAGTNWDVSTCGAASYVTRKVLPLFSTRDVKDISTAVCDKFGVGLRAQVLVQAQPLAEAR